MRVYALLSWGRGGWWIRGLPVTLVPFVQLNKVIGYKQTINELSGDHTTQDDHSNFRL